MKCAQVVSKKCVLEIILETNSCKYDSRYLSTNHWGCKSSVSELLCQPRQILGQLPDDRRVALDFVPMSCKLLTKHFGDSDKELKQIDATMKASEMKKPGNAEADVKTSYQLWMFCSLDTRIHQWYWTWFDMGIYSKYSLVLQIIWAS